MLSERLPIETESQIFKMGAPNGKYLYFSSIQDSKEIPKANAMLSGSVDSMALLDMLFLETGGKIIKMAAAKPKVYLYLSFYTR
jgi:hypothetical protein